MPSDDEDRIVNRRRGGLLPAIGGGAALVVCCAAPVLLALGVLGTVAAFLREYWLLLLTAVALAGVIGWAWWRRRHAERP